jgi:hypothetical protein
MTASAPIVGTLRTIPDAASISPQGSGVPAHANFRSVLEQVHAPRESDSNADDLQSSHEQKEKDSDPTTTLAVPQAATPPVETPRVILPFTTSLTLRQDATAAPDDTAPQDATVVADLKEDSTGVIFRSMIDQRSFAPNGDARTNSAPSGTQPKTQTKSHAKLQAPVTAPPASTTTADPSVPQLPVTSSITLDQATTTVQISSTVNEAPGTVSISTSTLDRGLSTLATTRNAAYQFHSSQGSNSGKVDSSRAAQQQQKVPDPGAAITVPVPVTDTVEPQRLIHLPAGSTAPRQDAPALQNSSAVAQDSSAAAGTDSKTAMPPSSERKDDTAAAPPTGPLAFAARLTPTQETPTLDSTPAPDSQSRVPAAPQSATLATAKQIASEADLSADAHSGESGGQSDKENRFAKPEMVLPQTHATFPDQNLAAATSHASASMPSPAARMDQVQEPPATAPSGNHDITIRIPDSNTEQGTAVRFVERAGEVHVSVRTGDAEMAQTLRGGLNDLVNRLEDGGMRTQVWQPGTDSSTSQKDSHHPFADPDGSNGRQYSSGSNSEQESKQHNKPRWVEELEGSIGNPNFKETTPLLWQA